MLFYLSFGIWYWEHNIILSPECVTPHKSTCRALLWVASSCATVRSVKNTLNKINNFLYILSWPLTTTFVLKKILSFLKAYLGFILTLLHIKVQGWSFVLAVKTTTASSAEGEEKSKTCRMQLNLNLKATVSEHTWYSPQEQDTQENWGFKWASI